MTELGFEPTPPYFAESAIWHFSPNRHVKGEYKGAILGLKTRTKGSLLRIVTLCSGTTIRNTFQIRLFKNRRGTLQWKHPDPFTYRIRRSNFEADRSSYQQWHPTIGPVNLHPCLLITILAPILYLRTCRRSRFRHPVWRRRQACPFVCRYVCRTTSLRRLR